MQIRQFFSAGESKPLLTLIAGNIRFSLPKAVDGQVTVIGAALTDGGCGAVGESSQLLRCQQAATEWFLNLLLVLDTFLIPS